MLLTRELFDCRVRFFQLTLVARQGCLSFFKHLPRVEQIDLSIDALFNARSSKVHAFAERCNKFKLVADTLIQTIYVRLFYRNLFVEIV